MHCSSAGTEYGSYAENPWCGPSCLQGAAGTQGASAMTHLRAGSAQATCVTWTLVNVVELIHSDVCLYPSSMLIQRSSKVLCAILLTALFIDMKACSEVASVLQKPTEPLLTKAETAIKRFSMLEMCRVLDSGHSMNTTGR